MISFMILAILPQALLSFATWGATTAAADAPTAAASTAAASGEPNDEYSAQLKSDINVS